MIQDDDESIPDESAETTAAGDAPAPDVRFIDDRRVVEEIVTSAGQNDSGMFEPAMRDERYLPFEGAGAISSWRLELPKEFKSFDYGTISDVILHLRYTAQDGGEALHDAAADSARNLLREPSAQPLRRLFSLRHEFPSEWHRFVNAQPATPGEVNKLTVDLAATRFPYFVQNRDITIKQATALARTKEPAKVGVAPGEATPALNVDPWEHPWTGQDDPGPWTFGTDAEPKDVEDVFVIFEYSVS